MRETLLHIKSEALTAIARVRTTAEIDVVETEFLGRKGALSTALRTIGQVPKTERAAVGQLANQVKDEISQAIGRAREKIGRESRHAPVIDLTWPGHMHPIGHLHPITQFLDELEDIFVSMGFAVVEGPEVETPEYNFDLLNIPKNHPARDAWDTFYVEGGLLLRTHTSPVQLRAMQHRKPPIRLIAPGRVFRHEATDAGHETTFYQCEGLVIDRHISVSNLIGTLQQLLRALFGSSVHIRVRPEFYPFVEPGLDIDMQCLICGGSGCSVCKQRGWLEMLGSGMVHPQVLKNMRIDPAKYSGFAFGLGVDRLMMLRHGVNDIRLSYSGDLRFLSQF
ncbi:MAG: phenylalanine--tRNA ligase subunit alpha [Patescibacteria group bacterium]